MDSVEVAMASQIKRSFDWDNGTGMINTLVMLAGESGIINYYSSKTNTWIFWYDCGTKARTERQFCSVADNVLYICDKNTKKVSFQSGTDIYYNTRMFYFVCHLYRYTKSTLSRGLRKSII